LICGPNELSQHRQANEIILSIFEETSVIRPEIPGDSISPIRDGRLLYSDDDHLSPEGAELFFGRTFRELLGVQDDVAPVPEALR